MATAHSQQARLGLAAVVADATPLGAAYGGVEGAQSVPQAERPVHLWVQPASQAERPVQVEVHTVLQLARAI